MPPIYRPNVIFVVLTSLDDINGCKISLIEVIVWYVLIRRNINEKIIPTASDKIITLTIPHLTSVRRYSMSFVSFYLDRFLCGNRQVHFSSFSDSTFCPYTQVEGSKAHHSRHVPNCFNSDRMVHVFSKPPSWLVRTVLNALPNSTRSRDPLYLKIKKVIPARD